MDGNMIIASQQPLLDRFDALMEEVDEQLDVYGASEPTIEEIVSLSRS